MTLDQGCPLPHQDAAWKIIKERLDALEDACASLSKRPGLSALAPLSAKLQSMSQFMADHAEIVADPVRQRNTE